MVVVSVSLNTPYQYTLSIHPINNRRPTGWSEVMMVVVSVSLNTPPYQYTLSIHLINTPNQYTLTYWLKRANEWYNIIPLPLPFSLTLPLPQYHLQTVCTNLTPPPSPPSFNITYRRRDRTYPPATTPLTSPSSSLPLPHSLSPTDGVYEHILLLPLH